MQVGCLESPPNKPRQAKAAHRPSRIHATADTDHRTVIMHTQYHNT
jgi:hypothetical protein